MRTEIANMIESIRKRVEQAARNEPAREVMDGSRLLEAAEKLLSSYNALEARFRSLKNQFGNLGVEGHPSAGTSDTSLGLVPSAVEQRKLGRRGNENLEDYLIPVIKLMYNGKGYRDAFRHVAKDLDVRYNTVSAQCTRALGLTTAKFDDHVRSRRIVHVLRDKYPDRREQIDKELAG